MSQINKIIAGRYVLKESIGQGGMADVYLAYDKILQRTVAVKIMRSSLTGDPVYVTRFHREASAAAALTHKNIVEIYDVGEEGDDYYIVMEYVPGQTLKELIYKRGALHYVEAIDVMKQVASATAKAHSMGIVHRDLKPQNIMVTDSGVVKIGDFGIASIQSLSQVTQTDTIMGSLHYLAPEVARGEKATVQSDIYALGIVFYELLRGDVPFNGESPVNIALKHMRDEIPSVRQFNPSIPQSVENIIIKATAKNIKERYQSASEMYEDLLVCLTKENEEKLTFNYQESEDTTTIVANDKDFFTKKESVVSIEEEPAEEKKPLNKKRIGIISGIIASCLVLFAVIYFIFLKPVDNFRMPDVVGMEKQQAIVFLESQGLKVNTEFKEEVSDEYETGKVTASDPMRDTAVQKGIEVTLTISTGKYIVIDDYVGKKYSEIEKELIELGFESKNIKKVEEVSDEDKGVILEQSLLSGDKIDPNEIKTTVITLTVSKGYSQEVPNLLKLSIDQAKSDLEELGFNVELKKLTPPTTAEEIRAMEINVVITQSIPYKRVITKKGTTIVLGYYDHKPEIPQEPEPPTPDTPSNNNPNHNNGDNQDDAND